MAETLGLVTTPSANQDVEVVLRNQQLLLLRVTVYSRVEKVVSLYKAQLPWGNKNSLMLLAVTPGGQCLQRFSAIDDPRFERVSVEPRGSLSGEVKLKDYFTNLEGAVKKSDIQLFWAYKAPGALGIAQWSGGWILIPKQK